MNDKTERLLKKTYLKFIRNSIGSKMFRNFYLKQGDETFDSLKDGELSCAFYVSSVLTTFALIERIHGTVAVTVKDLENSGWARLDKPTPGDVIVWDADAAGHEHIGFYIGRAMAVSNSTAKRKISKHHWTYNDTRKVIAIYSLPTLK